MSKKKFELYSCLNDLKFLDEYIYPNLMLKTIEEPKSNDTM